MKTKMINVNDCIPMKELERDYYDPNAFQFLVKTIKRDGFKDCYAIRGIWNEELERYEIFDGIHRWEAARKIGIQVVPFVDETGNYTRATAIKEGILANKTHAFYNPMDLAMHLKVLGETYSFFRRRKKPFGGRPIKYSIKEISDKTGFSESNVYRYLQLLELPEDVQKLIGRDPRYTIYLLLLGLRPDYEGMIVPLAKEVYQKKIAYRDLERRIYAIKHGKKDDLQVCDNCKRAFPKDSLNKYSLCPQCVQNLGDVREDIEEEKNKIMSTYLRVNNALEKYYTKQGKEIPQCLKEHREKLYDRWKRKLVILARV